MKLEDLMLEQDRILSNGGTLFDPLMKGMEGTPD